MHTIESDLLLDGKLYCLQACVSAFFSPEILQTWAVKGLIVIISSFLFFDDDDDHFDIKPNVVSLLSLVESRLTTFLSHVILN